MAIRTFIAIEIPNEIKNLISAETAALAKAPFPVKWVRPESLHLTLKFLGSTEENVIEKVSRELSKTAEKVKPFSVTVKGAGGFPNLVKPRVIWIGLKAEDGLYELKRKVEKVMAPLGFDKEKRAYSPHLTIGRIKAPGGLMGLKQEIESLRALEFGSFEATGFSLIKSDLLPGGAVYSRLKEFPLGRQNQSKQKT